MQYKKAPCRDHECKGLRSHPCMITHRGCHAGEPMKKLDLRMMN
ncbi:hypothetical protein MIZ01_1777 [Sideroxyarcus emersonii]|uniref:Uncharacterized protein n=1 Tax=Sideroxyarcus emersonii TaxID=2764705 RepID=A0AAN1XAJ8_9PROT|nr:hypothetical protein MIZ01_1777 [Sideroxyarcus emersonii]